MTETHLFSPNLTNQVRVGYSQAQMDYKARQQPFHRDGFDLRSIGPILSTAYTEGRDIPASSTTAAT